jgi:hypothetical protein
MITKDIITGAIREHGLGFRTRLGFVCTAEGCNWCGEAVDFPGHQADEVFKALVEAGL